MIGRSASSRSGLAAALGASALVAAAPAPAALLPPAGNVQSLVLDGAGTQNYRCEAAGGGAARFVFTGPTSVLSRQGAPTVGNEQSAVPGIGPGGSLPGCFTDAAGRQLLCPTFRSIVDRSVVWSSKVAAVRGGEPGCPDAGGVACLLLRIVATVPAAGVLSGTTFVQRLDTHGGLPPSGACTPGTVVAVPYSATYRFFRQADGSAATP